MKASSLDGSLGLSCWYQCSGSMTFWCESGSGSADPCLWLRSGYRIGILLLSSLTFKMPTKNNEKNFSAFYFWKVHLHHFSKILSSKKSQNSRNQGFLTIFACCSKGSGSIPLTNGSGYGSGRPKIMWIRIRIRVRIQNTDYFQRHQVSWVFFSYSIPMVFVALGSSPR
jgi:hypothetical protein